MDTRQAKNPRCGGPEAPSARLTLSRVKAYGAKWYKWYVGQRLWQQSKSKVIPEEYRKFTLIEFGPQGDYYISSKLRKLFQETRDA